jgi:ferredoxin-NADP reductase
MSADAATLSLRVLQARRLNPLIRLFRLGAADGGPLPSFTPGAHIRVRVAAARGGEWRHYSLINLDPDVTALHAPRQYTIAVRLEPNGRGGSRFMHESVQEGDLLEVLPPRNDFPLVEDGSVSILIGGGIGITPLTSMAAYCVGRSLPARLHYAGRSRALMVLVPELRRLLGSRLMLHEDDVAGGPLDPMAVLGRCAGDERLYVCGPAPMLDGFLAAAQRLGWSRDRVHFEIFSAPPTARDTDIVVELARSRRSIRVAPDQSILDALIEAGCDVLYDCRRGECGVCRVDVLDGDIDHRDHVLTDGERAGGKVMQVCVSRARGGKLVLDL